MNMTDHPNHNQVMAIITARGGSKSIPRKNIIPVGGKPLIVWTIEAARQSSHVHRVIVSTDDAEIAEIAKKYGAETPFLRPSELSGDHAPHIPVLTHALQWVSDHENYRPSHILLLQPTSPLRSSLDIENSIQLCHEKQADSVISVCEAHPHPYLMKNIDRNGRISDFLKKPHGYLQRQDFPQVYAVNGAIYFIKTEIFLKYKGFYTDRTYAYIMPSERSIDVDSSWDLYLVNLLLKENLNAQNH